MLGRVLSLLRWRESSAEDVKARMEPKTLLRDKTTRRVNQCGAGQTWVDPMNETWIDLKGGQR